MSIDFSQAVLPVDLEAQGEPRGLRSAISDLGLPMFIFGVIFLLAMAGLTALLSPGRFPVKIGGSMVRLRDLAQQEQDLLNRQQELLRERGALDAQLATPVLYRVRLLRPKITTIGGALQSIESIRLSFTLHDWSPIAISDYSYSDTTQAITLTGAVHDMSDRSATILASFVDSLRQSGWYAKVSEPEYKETITKDGMHTIPFHFTLSLRHAS